MNYTRYYIGPGGSQNDLSRDTATSPFAAAFTEGLDLNLNLPKYDNMDFNLNTPGGQAQFNFFQGANLGLPTFSSENNMFS